MPEQRVLDSGEDDRLGDGEQGIEANDSVLTTNNIMRNANTLRCDDTSANSASEDDERLSLGHNNNGKAAPSESSRGTQLVVDKDSSSDNLPKQLSSSPAPSSLVSTSPLFKPQDGNQQQQQQQRPFPPPFYCPITKEILLDPVVAPDGLSYERDIFLEPTPPTISSSSSSSSSSASASASDATSQHSSSSRTIGLTEDQLYPNRALQAIMADTLELTADTWEAGIRRLQRSVSAGIQQLLDHSLGPSTTGSSSSIKDEDENVPPLHDAYYCPITFDLMHAPMIDPEGNTYERAAIVSWIRANGTSPLSRAPLAVVDLYPNHAIRQLLEYQANCNNSNPNLHSLGKHHGNGSRNKDNDSSSQEEGTATGIHPALLRWKNEPTPAVPEDVTSRAIAMGDDDEIHNDQDSANDSDLTPWNQLDAQHERLRRQRKRVLICTVISVICFISATLFTVWFTGYAIFFSVWLGCFLYELIWRLRETDRERKREEEMQRQQLAEMQQRVDAWQGRLERLRQPEDEASGEAADETNGEAADASREGSPESATADNDDDDDPPGPSASTWERQRHQLLKLEQRLNQLRIQYIEQGQEQLRQRHQERVEMLRQRRQQLQEEEGSGNSDDEDTSTIPDAAASSATEGGQDLVVQI